MVVAVANQKGGCAKTTTSVNLAAALAKGSEKYACPPSKVLLIDLDPQGNCATSFGLEKKQIKKTVYDLLSNDIGEKLPLMEEYLIPPEQLTKAMQKQWTRSTGIDRIPRDLSADNLWLLPSDIHLSGAEIELSHKIGRETRLREALEPIIDEFDYIIIDTPPSLGLLSINALSASNWVMIPVQAEYYALEGFSMLMNSIKMIQKRINRNLKVFGVVMTMVDKRSKLSTHVVDEVSRKIPNKVFNSHIRRLAKVAEAAWSGAPTVLLDTPNNRSTGAGSHEYWSLAKQFHQRTQAMRQKFGVTEHPRLLLERQGRKI
ncbi:MAG: sporulation initiation inhibitor Soj [Euryarchaeota archaeon]|nr:sporulation initiation inhibitor Soj [Euryarchaeota archaeon]MBR60276.1 sporulation initiation inhibitor Soj [Euryarchaeota archaeon]DAC15171.1 MAG TPA: ParA family protein [Candidatus Poseidoniales archaeon]HII63421.1 ParA family protein [Candidatus Poseidoniaceae archaeon]|tara:strand:+ start:1359 stop:2309 length:951 start_codon:yes stop_codon:yes gene_type:complete